MSATNVQCDIHVYMGLAHGAGSYLYKGQKWWVIFVRITRSMKMPSPNCSANQGFPTHKLAMAVLPRLIYYQEGSVPL